MLFTPSFFWSIGFGRGTRPNPKKIEHQAVVSGEATNYDDVLSSHKWGVGVILLLFMKVRAARLNGSAQNLSGVPCFWTKRSPLAPSLGTSGVVSVLLLDDVVYPHDLVGIVWNIGFGVCVGVAPIFVIPNNVGTGSRDGDFHCRHLPFH